MEEKVPQAVVNYLRDQLVKKKKPKQRAIENAYNYWKGIWRFIDKELPSKEACFKILQTRAREIQTKGS